MSLEAKEYLNFGELPFSYRKGKIFGACRKIEGAEGGFEIKWELPIGEWFWEF